MKKKLLKKITQKTTIIVAIFVLCINIIFPTKSQAVDVGGLLAKPITSFALLLLDTIEGGLQYFFLGGPISTVTVTFDADEYKTIAKQFKLAENKSNTKVEDVVTDYQSWFSENWLGSDEKGWDYVVTKFSPVEIFSNQIPMFSINFIDPPDTKNNQKLIASELQGTISSWYKALRMLAFVGMLSILVYVGIRIMLSSTAADKAKYKNMIMDWVIALCLLFFLHYIMEFTIIVTDSVTSMVASVGGDFEVKLKKESSDGKLQDAKTDLDDVPYVTNLMGLSRFRAQNENLAPRLIYIIIYAMLVGYTVIFTFTYLKRVLMMAFLTVISPVVVLTYPIDKISDGNAQGFNMWLKEYAFNALLQPVHLILYTVLVDSAIGLATDNPIYAIAAMMFILPAEKIMRKFFNFSKAQAGTMSGMEGFAGGLIAKDLIGNVASKVIGKGGKSSGNSNALESATNSKVRMQNKPGIGSAFAGVNNNSNKTAGKKNLSSGQTNPGTNKALNGENNKNNKNNKTPEEKARQEDFINRRDALQNMIDDPNTTPEDRAVFQEEVDYYNKQLSEAEEPNMDNSDQTKPNLMTSDEAQQLISGKEKRKRVINGIKNVAKSNGKGLLKKGIRLTAGGGMALAAGGMALAGGDVSKGLSAAAGGYAAGVGMTKAIPAIGKSISDKVSSTGSNIANQYREGAYGLNEAQKILEEKAMEQQKKEFMKDKSNEEKYKEMAYNLGTDDYKKVMQDAYDLKTFGIKDENIQKTLEVAYGNSSGDQGVGLDKAAAVSLQTQKYGSDILLDEKKSQVLEKKFAKEIMSKGDGNLTEEQAKTQAKEVMRIYEKFG